MKTMNPPSELRITDSHLAAYLLCRGHRIFRVDGPSSRREFVFRDVPTGVITAYYGGDDLVSARALLDALRNVKGLLAQAGR